MSSLANLFRSPSSRSSASKPPPAQPNAQPRKLTRNRVSVVPPPPQAQAPVASSSASTPQLAIQPLRKSPSPPLRFSDFSSPSVPNSGWASCDFMLGAGMVIIQPSTHKVVVLRDLNERRLPQHCFFPRGRKDVGESLEHAALREAYEESGYRVSFLPLFMPHHQPPPPQDLDAARLPCTEPIFMTCQSWGPRYRNGQMVDRGGQYLITWYVGQIAEDAIPQQGTGMSDEQGYQSYLVTYDEAMQNLTQQEASVLKYAFHTYCRHLEILQSISSRQMTSSAQDEQENDEAVATAGTTSSEPSFSSARSSLL